MVRILQGFVNVDFSVLYYGFAITILVVCAILLGLKEARKILMLTIIYPSILLIFENFHFSLLEEKDLFLAAIYCGVLGGICSGLVFTRGYSFGGTDTIAKIIQKKLIPMSVSANPACHRRLYHHRFRFSLRRNIALYALVTQVIFSKTVDYVMYGFDTKAVQLEIITSKHDEVAGYILNEVGGV
jgi:uncharacterized membrane-anchored protein YitT (DUF2179 family)